jgi:hypothetical protein
LPQQPLKFVLLLQKDISGWFVSIGANTSRAVPQEGDWEEALWNRYNDVLIDPSPWRRLISALLGLPPDGQLIDARCLEAFDLFLGDIGACVMAPQPDYNNGDRKMAWFNDWPY